MISKIICHGLCDLEKLVILPSVYKIDANRFPRPSFYPQIFFLKHLWGSSLRNRWHRHEGGLEEHTARRSTRCLSPRTHARRCGLAMPASSPNPPRLFLAALRGTLRSSRACCSLTDGRCVQTCLPHGAAASPLRRAAAQLACMFSARPACRGPPRA